MRVDRRLVLIGVMVVVLSMTMATQYATTYIGYSFAIVHPSNADVRFIGSDNSSDDGTRVLRVTDNDSAPGALSIELGDFPPGTTKNYTAVFGIVNEENFSINITHINITGTNTSYITMWLHGDRDANYEGEGATCVKVVDSGTALYDATTVPWTLGKGDGTTSTMSMDYSTNPANATHINTIWDETGAHVRYSVNDVNNSINETSDFVWVGLSLKIPAEAALSASVTGTIYVNFKATTD